MSYDGKYSMHYGSLSDFAEAMSQIFENWIWDYDMLSRFARHHITGQVLPRQVFDNMLKARNITSGLDAQGAGHANLLRELRAHPQIDAQMSEEDWPVLLEELGAETVHPEGLFLPETYRFPRNTSDRTVLKQAYQLMQEVLNEEWPNRDENTPVTTPYEALILASIVEKETARADERFGIELTRGADVPDQHGPFRTDEGDLRGLRRHRHRRGWRSLGHSFRAGRRLRYAGWIHDVGIGQDSPGGRLGHLSRLHIRDRHNGSLPRAFRARAAPASRNRISPRHLVLFNVPKHGI